MKTVIYILIAVIVSSVLLSAIPKTKNQSKQTITIQCVDENYTDELLNKSVEIIKSRLNDFGVNKFEVAPDYKNLSIDISMQKVENLSEIVSLVTSKGEIEFYETFDRLEIIEELGVPEDLASILNVPKDEVEFKRYSGVFGYCKQENTSAVQQYVDDHYIGKPDSKLNFFWGKQPDSNGDVKLYLLKHNASLNKSYVMESSVEVEKQSTQPVLSIIFSEDGALKWKELTKSNSNKAIAIVLDKKVIFAPYVMSEIGGGRSLISGDFTKSELSWISTLINNESLLLNFQLKE